MESGQLSLPIKDFISKYFAKYNEILSEHILSSMHHVIEVNSPFFYMKDGLLLFVVGCVISDTKR